MMHRRFRSLPVVGLLGLSILLACTSCTSVLNPSLVGTLGSNTAAALEKPQGTVVIMLVNRTASSVQADVEIIRENGAGRVWPLQVGPVTPGRPNSGFLNLAMDCDVMIIDVVRFVFSIPGGVPAQFTADLGALNKSQDFFCGDVVVITANGTAPNITFSVEVF